MASNAENVSIWWRHHICCVRPCSLCFVFCGKSSVLVDSCILFNRIISGLLNWHMTSLGHNGLENLQGRYARRIFGNGLCALNQAWLIWVSYTLSREYRMVRNRYSRLLFTIEDRLCANLRVQEQSTNMTSQCLAFAWRHRSTVMTSQC